MGNLHMAKKRISFLVYKGIKSLHDHGLIYTFRKATNRIIGVSSYSHWMKKPLFTEAQLEMQRSRCFNQDITFSFTVPLYNTPKRFLQEMIESVLAQTYVKWELCMADGSDDEHHYVEEVCREYSERDKRIKYQKLAKNLGISGNTNACIDMAAGTYVALLDQDDILHPAALHEVMTLICEKNADFIYTDEVIFENPDSSKVTMIHFKPDFAPDNLRATNYICHFTVFDHSLIYKTGGFRSEYDGSQDHDLFLRLTAVAKNVIHIPEVLYYCREHNKSAALAENTKDQADEAGRKAVENSLASLGINANVENSTVLPGVYRIRYEIIGCPKISIVIPNYENLDALKCCIGSIQEKSTYENYEIIIIENNSKQPQVFEYYEEIQQKNSNITVITWQESFNYSAINNFGVKSAAKGDYILLLNNDTEVITPGWMEEMLMYAQRENVGAVGAMLYYPNDTIQHAGVILGLGDIAGHAFCGIARGSVGYMGRLTYAQNVTAVTAACMLVRRDVWNQVDGLDERFKVAYNDVDLCMKIRKAGYLIVWTPHAELYHYESLTRGQEDTAEKKVRYKTEIELLQNKWQAVLEVGDPYYNPNLTLERPDFSLKM